MNNYYNHNNTFTNHNNITRPSLAYTLASAFFRGKRVAEQSKLNTRYITSQCCRTDPVTITGVQGCSFDFDNGGDIGRL